MKAIDDDGVPDAKKLEALKALFYGVNKMSAADSERVVAYRLLQIAKRLTSGELFLLINGVFAMYKAKEFDPNSGRITPVEQWAAKVSNRIHIPTALALRDERRLVEEELISPRVSSPERRVHGVDQQHVFEENARLTDLGVKFCTMIANYETETK